MGSLLFVVVEQNIEDIIARTNRRHVLFWLISKEGALKYIAL